MNLLIGLVAVLVIGGALFAILKTRRSGSQRTASLSRHIDAFTVQEPWRRYVLAAQKSRRRFDTVLSNAKDGATKDRLSDIGRQLDDIVARIWEVAQSGHLLSEAAKLTDVSSLERKLTAAEAALGTAPEDRQAAAESSLSSVRSSLEAARRVAKQRDDAENRLEALDNRLDELVVRATEVATVGVEAQSVDQLRVDLDSLVVDLEGLRQGLEETRRVATA
jgi:hypothetical protein